MSLDFALPNATSIRNNSHYKMQRRFIKFSKRHLLKFKKSWCKTGKQKTFFKNFDSKAYGCYCIVYT